MDAEIKKAAMDADRGHAGTMGAKNGAAGVVVAKRRRV